MDEIGVKDPEMEFNRWLEERETILRMNKELSLRPARDRGRESAVESRVEVVEESSL